MLRYTWLLDEFSQFLSIWTRILRRFSPFSRRMEKCAQSMPHVDGSCHDGREGGRERVQRTGTGPCQFVSVTDYAWLRVVDILSRLDPH